MKHYASLKTLLFSMIFLICAAFPVTVYLVFDNSSFTVICLGFTAAVFLLVLLACFNSEHYLRRTVISLSDLLASITDLQKGAAFSDTEDTLLSKLQSQTLRLTGILQAQQRNASERENEIKTLVSDISHQLKTPVAALKMYGELLQDEGITPAERKEYLSTLMTALQKLEFLMDSLIKMSRLESHIIQLKPEAYAISQTVLDAVMQCRVKATAKNIDISFDEKNQDLILSHDRRWTAEAIFNILDNAVKYTNAGGSVRITLQKYEMFCRLDICDTGRGILEAEQEKVFQRFFRGSGSLSEEGLGIGLYLSRSIITAQGGYLKLSSGETGSTFSLFMPL